MVEKERDNMILQLRTSAITLATILLLSLPLFAGGGRESAPAAGTDSAAGESSGSAGPSGEEVTAAEAEMKELLEKIGIRTFDGEIASVDFDVPALADHPGRLSAYRGEFVFLNFWATWCPPCREEMPSMEAMQAELDPLPVRILAVNVQEGRPVVGEFVSEMGYTFPILLDESGQVAANYGVRGIPTTYFISPTGRVLGMLVGTRYWDEPEVLAAMRRIGELAASLEG
jgi:thiol-disulfide isomerase/thioredoxin